MSRDTLDKEHPLTKAGLRFVHVVEKVELGLKPGDVVFEFPYGRDCRHRYGVSTGANNSAWRRRSVLFTMALNYG